MSGSTTFDKTLAIVITEGNRDVVAETFMVKEKIETPQCSARFKYTMTQSAIDPFHADEKAKPVDISNKPTEEDNKPSVPNLDESQLDDDSLCTICYSAKANTVLLDCGHGGICIDCATDTMRKNNYCLFCRQRVIQIIEIDIDEVKRGLYKVINSYFVSDGIYP